MEIPKLILVELALLALYGLAKRFFSLAWIFGLLVLGCSSALLTLYTDWYLILLCYTCPLFFLGTCIEVFIPTLNQNTRSKYQVHFTTHNKRFQIENIKRGASVIASAGSGKTESVVYQFLKHFQKHQFCGIIHDYKNFELTEIAYPLFQKSDIPFYTIAFDDVIHKVNPIAPRYLPNEESVNEVARVLLENLLEQKEQVVTGSSKFFNDAAEGLLCGMIWRLKEDLPNLCTLPHMIALYQYLDTKQLVLWLSENRTSRIMASAFISGMDSEKQTAGVMSTLANALKRISTKRIFMALSADEVPLNLNSPENPAVISVVNNPKYESAYSPVIATILHTAIKQMSVREQQSSFLMMEEAPTIRLLNMHRIPATLRSYDVATIYVMQDKVQNDMMYGDKASRAILANLSYQFFGKVNDPDTAKYYERFFEIIKNPTKSVSKGYSLDFDTRVTTGEREVSKVRADVFFRLKQGEFITYADGIDRKVQFKLDKIKRQLPQAEKRSSEEDYETNFKRVHWEILRRFRS
ncbi:type IV secretory system conjugative DNA transfer family protein [Leeuwenhoekiella parthenopeia]|uniref:Type IV secretion system DNA-binding domain-containing protein n=1 Tax=Leeuwenhoekiella parthenopeia TaxID=2890320 RepID=A0ABS8GX85_9FLAO|nr:type IV secretion system DNA-binding domain-containing protein [Leeuwenhoekiella parthenopeia]MCC4214398.1 type IV secretion system DNA-binding domain-containing protein [Leeuwenhoekiella parthenopeia]